MNNNALINNKGTQLRYIIQRMNQTRKYAKKRNCNKNVQSTIKEEKVGVKII